MKTYVIPRGLKVKEVVAYGLTGKQIIYIAGGLGCALGVVTLPLSLDLKIALGVLSVAASFMLSLAKRHGQELDRYIWNSAKYAVRNKEVLVDVMEKESEITINFHARQPSAV